MIMKMHTEISKNNNNNSDLGSRLASYSGESRQSAFFFQRISVAIETQLKSCSTTRLSATIRINSQLIIPTLISLFACIIIIFYPW